MNRPFRCPGSGCRAGRERPDGSAGENSRPMSVSTLPVVVMSFNQRASIRNVADLARAGFEIARQPVTKVDFEVHHVRARQGYLRELTSTEPANATFLETLYSSANGVGVAIGTRTSKRA